MNGRAIRTIAAQSFWDSLRGRWFMLFAITYFFLVIGFPIITLDVLSLLPSTYLATYLSTFIATAYNFIPLITLPMGATVVVDEREAGTLQYMMSNPISKSDFLSGRILGMLIATTGVVALGFLVATVFAYGSDFGHYNVLAIALVAAVMLNAIMLAISMIVSTVSKRRGAAVGMAIFLWFLFSVLADVGELGIMSSNTQTANPTIAVPGLVLDPVYTATSWAVLALGSRVTQSSAVSLISASKVFGAETTYVLMGIMTVWLAICLVTPYLLFRFRDVV